MAEDSKKQPQEQESPPRILAVVFMAVAGLILYSGLSTRTPSTKAVSYSEFVAAIQNGEVESVRVTNSQLIGTLKAANDGTRAVPLTTPRLPGIDESWLMHGLQGRGIQIIAEPQLSNWWGGGLILLFPMLMLLFFFTWTSRARSAQSGCTSVGKSRAKIYDQYTHSEVTFADVAGVEAGQDCPACRHHANVRACFAMIRET